MEIFNILIDRMKNNFSKKPTAIVPLIFSILLIIGAFVGFLDTFSILFLTALNLILMKLV